MPTNMTLHEQVMHALRQEVPAHMIERVPQEKIRSQPQYVSWVNTNRLANERLKPLGVRWETRIDEVVGIGEAVVVRATLILSASADYRHEIQDVGSEKMSNQANPAETASRGAIKRCWAQLGLGESLWEKDAGFGQSGGNGQRQQQQPQQRRTDPATEDSVLQRFWKSAHDNGWDAHAVQECLGSTWQVWQQNFPNAREATKAAWEQLTATNGAPRGQQSNSQQAQAQQPAQQQAQSNQEREPHHYCRCGTPVFDGRYQDCYACKQAPWRTPGWCVSCGQECKPDFAQCKPCKDEGRPIPSGPGSAGGGHGSGYNPDDDLPF